LAICRNLLQLMGGSIRVDSKPMQGSTFIITLPLQLDEVVRAEPVAITDTTPFAFINERSLQVLLVEDNVVNQRLCSRLLEKWGHRVTLAANGEEGLRLFEQQTWDVVLMDMHMPVMGGEEAVRLMRKHEGWSRHTPVIGVTANALASDKQACLDAGMDDHLAKPYSARELRDIINQHVRS
jgi:hypothetical protein